MRWTEDQERVINSRNRNLLVSAAAGSGKTAVLVERIVRMVTDEKHPVDLDRLLVMTFTNAAAAEMRERIGKAIGEKLSGEPENARLRLQMAIVPHAQIQTIDSFCLFLIRNHYAGLDIDPSFRVGDEGELTLLRSDVMAELLEDRYENGGEAFEQFVETYGSGRTDLGIEEVISQVYDFSVSHPWPKKWLAECRREFGEDGAEHFEETGWMQFLLQDVKRQMQEFAIQLADALEVCGEAGGPEAYLPAIREDLELVSGIRQAEDFQTLRLRLEQASFGKLKAIRSKEVEKEKKDYVSSIRDRVKKAVGKCRDQYASQTREEMVEAILGCAPAVCVLFDLAEEFLDRYQQAKKDRNLVDFGDLEHFALEVLYEEGKPSPAADELSRKYEEILVDEYQDSNYVQESLIQAVSRERFGTPNVFMVGDVKQSIYRFRQARPELFLEKYKRYGKEEGLYQKIELQKNFRSRSQVLDSINQVFYQIMGEALGGIRYTEEAALYPGAVFEPLPGDGAESGAGISAGEEAESGAEFSTGDRAEAGAGISAGDEVEVGAGVNQTELLVVNTGSRALSNLDEEARDFTSREIEVKLAVREIRRLTDPENGMFVWDKAQGGYRRARYGDVVILLRSLSGWAEGFVNGLMNEGIPAYVQSQRGYFDTTEVETMLSLLAVIDNPIQDIPLASVMKSPIIGMSDEELAWMMARFKRKAEKGQDRGIYGAWRLWMEETETEGSGAAAGSGAVSESGAAAESGVVSGNGAAAESGAVSGNGPAAENAPAAGSRPGMQSGIRRKLSKLDEMIAHFRHLSEILPIHQLLEKIYRETGYYAYVSAMPAGETRQANLDLLIEKAAAYESTSYQGLFHFIRYIEKLKKVDTDFGEAAVAGAEERTVRIMSIHKSKGLEFPIVILAGMGKKFNKKDAYSRLLIDPDFGVGADYLDLDRRLKSVTLKKQVLKRRLELEGLGEELRVLYVAMTRAKEKLIMTGTDVYLESKLEKWGIRTDEHGALRAPYGRPSPLPSTLLSGAGSYLDWIFMALPGVGTTISARQVPAESFVGMEILHQMEKQVSREMLLNQPEGVVYAPKFREELEAWLHYRYPYQADTSLYAMMSVSELKRRSQEAEGEAAGEAAVELFPELLPDEGETAVPAFSGRGALRGTAYHRALELLNAWECHSFGDVVTKLEELAAEGRFTREARRLVDAKVIWDFFQSSLGQRMAGAGREGRLHKEQQFMIGVPAREMGLADSDELVLIQGMIDAYIEETDGLILIDYKTDYVENLEELKKRYEVQIKYYARALEQVTGKPVKEAVLYSLRLQEGCNT